MLRLRRGTSGIARTALSYRPISLRCRGPQALWMTTFTPGGATETFRTSQESWRWEACSRFSSQAGGEVKSETAAKAAIDEAENTAAHATVEKTTKRGRKQRRQRERRRAKSWAFKEEQRLELLREEARTLFGAPDATQTVQVKLGVKSSATEVPASDVDYAAFNIPLYENDPSFTNGFTDDHLNNTSLDFAGESGAWVSLTERLNNPPPEPSPSATEERLPIENTKQESSAEQERPPLDKLREGPAKKVSKSASKQTAAITTPIPNAANKSEASKPSKASAFGPPKAKSRSKSELANSKPGKDGGKRSKKAGKFPENVTILHPERIKNSPVETDAHLDIPKLQHGLDRVLFNPGVHVMRDERSRVYNFDPDIATIMSVDEFDYDALGEYITSSKDEKLRELCAKYEKKYCGSTSSLSAILSHFHYLISGWRKPSFQQLSQETKPESVSFTQILRSPAAAFAHHRDGVYAIDADKQFDVENILSSLGKSMEKHLLLPKEEYEKYRLTRSHEISEEQRNAGESYHYSKLGDFLVRSQLDGHDPRLPGSGVFDLKTRAVVSIRMDVQGYEKGLGYEINQIRGTWDSFEREYMDMIRAAFLKYMLQVRMGRMDGIFCAYHNTQRIFGFQYIPLSELDVALHGTSNTRLGDEEFKASVTMLNALLDRASERWPGRTLRLHVETRPSESIPFMYFFATPVSEEEMQEVQTANKSSVAKSAAKVVQNLKGLQASMEQSKQDSKQPEDEHVTPLAGENGVEDAENAEQGLETDDVWDELMSKVEDLVENDSNGLASVRDAVTNAMERQGLLVGRSESDIQQSVDALVEALVGARTDQDVASPEITVDESEKVDVEGESAEARSLHESDSDSLARSKTSAEDETTAALDDSATAKERDDQDSTDTEVGDALEIVEDTSPSTEAETSVAVDIDLKTPKIEATSDDTEHSLKDLILRAAENADQRTGEMRAFERVFVELSAQAKADNSEEKPEASDEGEEAGEAPPASTTEGQESATEAPVKSSRKKKGGPPSELLGMVITVRNKVDGKIVDRPVGGYQRWEIGYSVTELEEEKAQQVYKQLLARRSSVLAQKKDDRNAQWYMMFRGGLKDATDRGRLLRKKLQKEDAAAQEVKVAWDMAPQPIKKS